MGEKDNFPHNGKNAATLCMCLRFKMWSWRHFRMNAYSYLHTFPHVSYWTVNSHPIHKSYYMIRWTMDLWVRSVTGWRRTRSFGVLLPAVLVKSRVKCLRAPALPSASREKCRFVGQRQRGPRDTRSLHTNLQFDVAGHSSWRSIFKRMKAKGFKGSHKEVAFDRWSTVRNISEMTCYSCCIKSE